MCIQIVTKCYIPNRVYSEVSLTDFSGAYSASCCEFLRREVCLAVLLSTWKEVISFLACCLYHCSLAEA